MAAGDVLLPKRVAQKRQTQTPFAGVDKGETITNARRQHVPRTTREMRDTTISTQAVKELVRNDGISSTALFSFIEIANSGFKLAAYDNITHEFSPEGTAVLRGLYAQFNTLQDYTKGFIDKPDPVSVTDTMIYEAVTSGAIAAELVMNKERLPDYLTVIPYETLEWVSRGDGSKYPQQKGEGDPISLDIPNFFVAEMHKPADVTYSASMLVPALEDTYHYRGFIEDIRRVIRQTGHSRTVVYLDAEKVQASADAATRADPKKMSAYMLAVRKDVEDVVSALEPEEALVTYDTARVEHTQTVGDKSDYKTLMDAIAGISATALKTQPSTIGLRLSGSQGLSNTESLVYLKTVRAMQKPVESVWSRALTMAVRLLGANVYAKYTFAPVNLRPEDELSAYRTMEQQRELERLALGFQTMEETAHRLGCDPLPAGYQDLMGTMFTQGGAQDNTTPNTGAQERVLAPDTPRKAGGTSQ